MGEGVETVLVKWFVASENWVIVSSDWIMTLCLMSAKPSPENNIFISEARFTTEINLNFYIDK